MTTPAVLPAGRARRPLRRLARPALLLRTRIVLLFAVVTVLFGALVGGPAGIVITSADRTQEDILLQDQRLLWQDSVTLGGQPYLALAKQLAGDARFVSLRAAASTGALTQRLAHEVARRQDDLENPVYRIDLVGADGRLIASSAGVGVDDPLVDAVGILRQLGAARSVIGVENRPDTPPGEHQLMKVASSALPADGGFIAVAGGFGSSVTALAEALKADTFVIGRDRKLISAIHPALWPQIVTDDTPLNDHTIIHLSRGGRALELVPSPIVDSTGNTIATVFTLRDVTFTEQNRLLLFCVTGALAAFLLVVLVTSLYGYLNGAFMPLGEVATAVRALSRGDTMVSVDLPSRADEVGQIAEAVEVFRRDAVELERLAFKGRIERAQQEALIRHEMTKLASTLDPEARAQVVADLEALQTGADATDEGRSGALLSEAFKHMAARVVEAHRQLSGLLAERTRDLTIVRQALDERNELTRIRQELDVARRLQLSSLPTRFPAFPDRTEFDLHAAMLPAREVGGDFYDYTLVDRDHLAVMIGDASGKGVSAALFIAVGRSLMRSAAGRGASPSECLEIANNTLCIDNETMMFATAFIAIIDLRTGDMVYANAGHNPPYIKRADGRVTTLDQSNGIALGVVEEMAFVDRPERLAPGDTFLLFTDGVTEATDAADTLFTESRLIDSLEDIGALSPGAVIDRVVGDIGRFVGTAEQADDITMICTRYLGAA